MTPEEFIAKYRYAIVDPSELVDHAVNEVDAETGLWLRAKEAQLAMSNFMRVFDCDK